MSKKANTPGLFLLSPEFRQAVDIPHFMRLAQQLSQRSHLSVDGGIAVAAITQLANQAIQHILREYSK